MRASSVERKTHKMMQRDLEAARKAWIKAAKSDQENVEREKTDFLAYVNHAGRYADFHSCRHLFITSLERAGARYVDACLGLRTLAVVIFDEGPFLPTPLWCVLHDDRDRAAVAASLLPGRASLNRLSG